MFALCLEELLVARKREEGLACRETLLR